MSDLVKRLRALSRADHDDLTVGDEAADEIERLRAEVEALHARMIQATQRNALLEQVDRMTTENERLDSEVEALRADAERYRWLRVHAS